MKEKYTYRIEKYRHRIWWRKMRLSIWWSEHGTVLLWCCFVFLMTFVLVGALLHFLLRENKKLEQSFEDGEMVMSFVKRVDWQGRTIFILTDDDQTFVSKDCNHKLLTVGDTLLYRRSTTGKVRLLEVKYGHEEYMSKHQEESHNTEYAPVQMPNPSYFIYGIGAPIVTF